MNTKCKTCRIFAAVALILMISISVADKYLVIPTASSTATTCDGSDEVVSGGGRCWKDRNLGAIKVATSPGDAAAFGDYYQWGRPRDGHQHPTSGTTSAKSDYDDPEHGDFILELGSYDNWRFPKNDNLWHGLGGINNPCPQGFRLPTAVEWETEMSSWDSNDITGAFASPLRLVLAGQRSSTDGSIKFRTTRGYYWSSTIRDEFSRALNFLSDNASMATYYRLAGMSVRCIKD